MRKNTFILLFIAIFILSAAYLILTKTPPASNDINTAKYMKISAAEAKEMMSGDYTLLDVRTVSEFNEGHISGAILIPDNEIAVRAKNELQDKNALILVYCQSGRRSALAANELVKQGYTNVYDFGGITSWPYDIVK